MAFDNRRAKRRKVGVLLIVLADVNVRKMACRLRAAVDGEMLRRRDDAIVMRMITLHTSNKSHGHARAQEWILAVGLLSAPPAGIAKDVDVRRPKIETLKDVRVTSAFVLSVFDPALDANRRRHLMNARYVERRRESDRLGKLCRPVHRDTMQCLAPPVVCWNVEARNGSRLIHELRRFLLKRHAMDQIRRALFRRKLRIRVWKVGIVLC